MASCATAWLAGHRGEPITKGVRRRTAAGTLSSTGIDPASYTFTFKNCLATLAVEMSGKSSPADVVTLLWTNLVGSTPSAAEAAPYIAMHDEGWGVGTLAMLAAEHPLNLANIDLAGLAQTGLEYIPYTG